MFFISSIFLFRSTWIAFYSPSIKTLMIPERLFGCVVLTAVAAAAAVAHLKTTAWGETPSKPGFPAPPFLSALLRRRRAPPEEPHPNPTHTDSPTDRPTDPSGDGESGATFRRRATEQQRGERCGSGRCFEESLTAI